METSRDRTQGEEGTRRRRRVLERVLLGTCILILRFPSYLSLYSLSLSPILS